MVTQFIKKPSTLEKAKGLEKLDRIGVSDFETVRNGTESLMSEANTNDCNRTQKRDRTQSLMILP